MQKVLFGVPSYQNTPCVEFCMAKTATEIVLLQRGIDAVWLFVGGDPYVHHARNLLASSFLLRHPDATDFFLIDDDLGWNAEDALKLVLRPEDIVCGIYPKKDKRGKRDFPVRVREEDGKVFEHDGLYQADLVPTGFLRIKRHVLERCAEESGQYPHTEPNGNQILCWDFFRTGFISNEPGGKLGQWWGEDYFFSFMARQLGFDIWFDPNMTFTHRGSFVWCDNFNEGLQAWIKTLNKEAVPVPDPVMAPFDPRRRKAVRYG